MAKSSRVRENTIERVPLHEQKKNLLTVEQKKGFVRRIVKTDDPRDPNRVQRFLKAGWRIVEDETKIGDPGALNQNQSIGTGIRKHLGEGIYGVLMEIEKELYDQDQEAKADALDKIESAMYKDHGVKDSYGEIRQETEMWGDESRPKRKRR